MKRRDRLEVIYDILRVIKEHNNSIRPTPLLRFSNLSSQSFADYQEELTDKGFIKIIKNKKGRKFFTLTDKGFEYLDKYRTIKSFIQELGL
jgi:predicted transcriptional regulator